MFHRRLFEKILQARGVLHTFDYVIIFIQDHHQYNCFVTTGKIISTIHGVFKDIGDRPSVSEMRQKYWTLKWCMFAITKISFFSMVFAAVQHLASRFQLILILLNVSTLDGMQRLILHLKICFHENFQVTQPLFKNLCRTLIFGGGQQKILISC